MKLNELKIGQSAVITGYDDGKNSGLAKNYRAKLLALGLTKGTKIKITNQAPLGDPIGLDVRGFSLSLRKDEAAIISVRAVES